MSFNILKTRRGKLIHKITKELENSNPSTEVLINIFNEYESSNLDTIKKLKRERSIESKKITGALKQCIKAHGPITLQFLGSATKRISGALLTDKTKKVTIKIPLINFIIGSVVVITLLTFLMFKN
jgi:hypothetical protein